ncbi:hypothetical protein [uncultured Nevskia sp.]|uniref:hypothetical protein n=1 Tax=uncultured Nevskia sp. TaxID=228950 RepID=UPI0025FE211A|nr:hypothetical protein [uncultured Nevskia sp.]
MKHDGSAAGPRHHDKVNKILNWTLRHSLIDRQTVQLLLKVSYSVACAILLAMVRENLLARILGHGVQSKLFRLTPSGARSADRTRGDFDQGLRALTNPDEIGVHYAAHNQVVARVAAAWLAGRDYDGEVLSPRQIRLHGLAIGASSEHKAAWKVPDAMLLQPVPEDERDVYSFGHFKTAIEVQQIDESHETRAYKLWQYWQAVSEGQIYDFEYVSSYAHIVNAFRDQWHHKLEERIYWVDKHRWTRPSNPRTIEPDEELLERASFRVLAHDPFAAGLYPSPAAMSKYSTHRD